jgi:hypothetical protein
MPLTCRSTDSDTEREEFATNAEVLWKHGSDLSEATMHLFDIFRKNSAEQEVISKRSNTHVVQLDLISHTHLYRASKQSSENL